MKPSMIKEAVKVHYKAKQPMFLWGGPGVGKSQVIKQATEELEVSLIDLRAVLLDPVDLRGIPAVNGDLKAHWCPPAFLPYSGNGILFLDELPAAPPLVQAACYQLVLDRKLGEYTLPDGWLVLGAGNRETDKAVVHRMPSPLANRFVHVDYDVDLDDWVEWALNHNIQTEIISFIRFRPALLSNFDPMKNEKAFPTPRSWEFVSKLLNVSPSFDLEYSLFTGCVGNGAATEFAAFMRICRQLPDPDMILMNPEREKVPTDPATLYAICGALSARASEQTIPSIVKYGNRMPDEFSVLLIRDSVLKDKNVTRTRAYIEWATKHKDVLI